jgi:glutathionylspermidine synthase
MTNFSEDHQVVRFLAQRFEGAGLRPVLFGPSQLRWQDGFAQAMVGRDRIRLDAVFRFFPAEWLPRLGVSPAWWRAVDFGGTRWVNPVSAVLTQSKRFPLVWPRLSASVPTWRSLVPETRSPRDVDDAEWVWKPALAHEGYDVGIAGVTERAAQARIARSARLAPWRWAAQRRFHAASLPTPDGPRFPCVGVYVVDGRVAGLYGRLAARPLIDDKAADAVVLVRGGT